MAAPFPLFFKSFMEIFSPNPKAFAYGSYFIPRVNFLEVGISKESHPHLDIEKGRFCMLLWGIDVPGIKGELQLKRYV
jgi:hypothetical protein